MKTLEVFFDYSSPFAYLGTTQVERIAAAHGAKLVLRPFLLGGLFQAIGTPTVPIATFPPAKRAYVLRDLERWAEHWGVPFRFTSHFPLRTVDALRLTIVAGTPALMGALMRAFWVHDRPPSRETLVAACVEAGVDVGALDEIERPEVKDRLREITREAVDRGVPGAPTFIVGDELFWGQDRLHFVEAALRAV